MSGSPPHFAASLRRLVLRFPTQEPCVLQALDENVTWTPQDETAIATICNEPLIYHRLFRKRLGGQPYSLAEGSGLPAVGTARMEGSFLVCVPPERS